MRSTVSLVILICLFTSCDPPKKELEKVPPVPVFLPASNPYYSRTDTSTLAVTDSAWHVVLPDSIFQVARKKGTEGAFTGKYWNATGLGTYYCVVCGNKLFRSDSKFASDCGWPSFFEPSRKNSVYYETDTSHGLDRIEVLCGRCQSHLGHLFDDGPPPTGQRYCMNSVILDFVPDIKTRLE
ncbi:MAG: peptide-methionine (R)-S-oxide reductase MsrB [Cytophagales bacterium]|nr:peptide-methionine (R)-S-oxide reductase MsrB [Cytophagales bacterium]